MCVLFDSALIRSTFSVWFSRAIAEKLNGNAPRLSYDAEKEEVTIDVDVIKMVGYATQVKVDFRTSFFPWLV